MRSGRRGPHYLRSVVLCTAVGGLLSACTPQIREDLRQMGIQVNEPGTTPTEQASATTTATTTVTTPATPAQASAAPQAAAPAVAAAPATAPVAPAAPTATVPAAAPAAPAAAPAAPATPVAPAAAVAEDPNFGWIAGSIGEVPPKIITLNPAGNPYATVQIGYHGRSNATQGTIGFTTVFITPTPMDFETEHEKSAIFAARLPVGDYVIDSLRFTDNARVDGHDCRLEHKLDIPFTVTPGTIRYLGSLLATAEWGDSKYKTPVPICGYFIVSDRSDRDQPVIHEQHHELTGPLDVQLLGNGSPDAEKYFRSK
jgi:hypothetical protein